MDSTGLQGTITIPLGAQNCVFGSFFGEKKPETNIKNHSVKLIYIHKLYVRVVNHM